MRAPPPSVWESILFFVVVAALLAWLYARQRRDSLLSSGRAKREEGGEEEQAGLPMSTRRRLEAERHFTGVPIQQQAHVPQNLLQKLGRSTAIALQHAEPVFPPAAGSPSAYAGVTAAGASSPAPWQQTGENTPARVWHEPAPHYLSPALSDPSASTPSRVILAQQSSTPQDRAQAEGAAQAMPLMMGQLRYVEVRLGTPLWKGGPGGAGRPLLQPTSPAAVVQSPPLQPVAAAMSASDVQAQQVSTPLLPRIPVADFEVDWSDLRLGDVLGQGAFGRVHSARWRGTAVAVKTLILPAMGSNSHAAVLASLVQDFKAEVAVISALRHPNILLFMGACTTTADHLALVTEIAPRGSVWDLLHTTAQPLPAAQVVELALGIARGMAYLHSHRPAPILHRDLKSANILLDAHGTVKVSDFGLARVKAVSYAMSTAGQMTGGIGTYQWMSPEVLANEAYTESADVYSYGIILWEMMTRQVPFSTSTGNQMQVALQVMTAGLRPSLSSLPRLPGGDCMYPAELTGLMTACWAQDPRVRPTFMHAIQVLEQLIPGL